MSFLTIDKSRCQGHGRCYSVAPDLLSDDEQGYVEQEGTLELTGDLKAQGEAAADACPELALRLSVGA